MDEFTPTPRRRPRRRRLKLSGALALLVAIAITALTQAAPDSGKGATPASESPMASATPVTGLQQAADGAKDAVLNAQPGLWHVAHVVDGDTIDVTMGNQKETVRFLGIDTPETHDPRKPVQCFGEAAAAHSAALLEGKNVRLEPDPTNSDRDKYHRLLRYVYLPDGTLVNAAFIHDGYAFAYTVFPLTKLDEFRALEAEARTANRGLWAGCNVDVSKDIRQTTSAR